MTTPEHLEDDFAAAIKAADDLLDALHHIRRQYRKKNVPPMVTEAIINADAVWLATRVDFPKLVQS